MSAPRLPRILLLVCALSVLLAVAVAVIWLQGREDPYDTFRRISVDHHLRLGRNLKPDTILLFGSSTIQGIDTNQLICPAANFGLGGETATALRLRLERYRARGTASGFVVQSGLAGLVSGEAIDIVNAVRDILDLLTGDGPVLLLGYQPISKALQERRPVLVGQIAETNAAVAKLCKEYPACHWQSLDHLADAQNWEADGLHLNAMGYSKLVGLLNRRLEPICGSPKNR